MASYHVNVQAQDNGDHEVHEAACSHAPAESNRFQLGSYDSCRPAVARAKQTYPQSNGCFYCCTACHTG